MDRGELGREIDRKMESALDGVFSWAYSVTEGYLKPSEVMSVFEVRWGIGDQWAEWWQSDDEGEWS